MSAVRDHAPAGHSDLRTLASGGVLNVAGSVANFLLQFLLVIVVTRALEPTGAGLFFEAIAIFSILASASQLGADTGLVRTISRFKVLGRTEDLRPILYVALIPVLVVGSIAAVALYVLAPQLADLVMHGVDLSEGVANLRVLTPFLPLAAATTVALSGARGFGTMLPYVAVEYVAKPLLRPLLVLLAVGLGLGATGVILGWALPIAVGFPVALAVIVRLLRQTHAAGPSENAEPPRPLGQVTREFWAFAAPRGLATLFQITIIWLSTLMVGAIAGVREAGIYAAASRFALVGLFALEAVRLAIAPQLSALLAANDKPRAQHLYQVGTWWIMIPSWPLYLTLAVFSPLLLQVFGPEFVAAQTALMIGALAMLVSMGTGNVTVILLMGGKSWWNLMNVFGALTLNVVLNLILIPRYGIEGAAVAWAATVLWENLIPLIQIRLHFKLHPFGRGYLVVAGAAIACFGVLGLAARGLLGPTLPALAATLVIGGAAYLRVLWRTRGLLELSALTGALRTRLRRGAREDADTIPAAEPPS